MKFQLGEGKFLYTEIKLKISLKTQVAFQHKIMPNTWQISQKLLLKPYNLSFIKLQLENSSFTETPP
jgi:hypothetical protein